MPDQQNNVFLLEKIRSLEAQLAQSQKDNERLKRDAAVYKTLFDQTLYEVHVWKLVRDETGKIKTWSLVDANPGALLSWGKKLEDIVGKCTNDIFMNVDATKQFMPIVEKIFENQAPELWEHYFPGTGQTLMMVSIPVGEIFISTGLDISDLKLTQQALQLSIEKAEAASVAKSQFLANMSHEIRTPLNAIVGFLFLMENSPLTDKQRRDLTRIKDAVSVLLTLINDVLDFSKIESKKMQLEHQTFDLVDLVQEVHAMFSQMCLEKSLLFELPDVKKLPVQKLVGDALHIRQIIINLLGNAVKFTHEGFVALNFELIPLTSEVAQLCIEVKDSGIGFDASAQSTLFEPFTQADTSTTRAYGGTGLGLSIVKTLCRSMGGTVSAYSESGKGSTFTARLLLGLKSSDAQSEVQATQADDFSTHKSEGALSGVRVLLVDDNELNREITQAVLELEHVSSVVALENGKVAVDWLREHADEVDVILMDIQMPILDGNSATVLIRQELKLAQIPIIGLSAGALQSEQFKALDSGMNDYLTKPIEPSKIRETLLRLLKK